jgi:hypothetical protein
MKRHLLRIWLVIAIAFSGLTESLAESLNPLINTEKIAVFKDAIPATGAPENPDYLFELLARSGLDAAFLNSGQLADANILNRSNFCVLLLAYGASFPVKAADNFRNFLREGGKFYSTGGYAFDNLLEQTDTGWQTLRPPPPPESDHVVWHYEFKAADLPRSGQLSFSGFMRTAGVRGPGMAYMAVYQFAADGSILQWIDFAKVTGTQDWKEFSYRFTVHPQTARVDFRVGLYRCSGNAWFDDFQLSDQTGAGILWDDFEAPFDPENTATKHWIRSDPKRCTVQEDSAHSGRRCLAATLEFAVPKIERLNTRHGRPADGLEVAPTQLGVFDADYRLERAASAHAVTHQGIIPRDLAIDGPLEGWAAVGITGYDQARWVPLVNAFDDYGRLRGAVGAMLRHSEGLYKGSSWVFFGLTNRAWVTPESPASGKAFVDIIRSLVRDTYFAWLVPDSACFPEDETPKLSACVFNSSRLDRNLRLTARVFAAEPFEADQPPAEQQAGELQASFTIAAGQQKTVALEWNGGPLTKDFYYVLAHLWEGNQEIDTIESAFMIRSPAAATKAPALDFKNNYLRLGKRPMFLFGTDDWSYTFTTKRETPLQWLRDMRLRRDLGVQIYENLQFGMPEPGKREQLLRQVDGIVQLAQKHQQVYFAGLLVGANVAASNPELERQKAFCREFAGRHKRIPGLIYYLNGDLRCELSGAVTHEFNDFLRQRYGTDEKLRAAWGVSAPTNKLGEIPAEDFNDWSFAWDDVRAYDLNRFRAALIRRWSEGLISGIREQDRTHPTSSEFYQLPHQGVDIPAGIDGLDLCNFGYFDKPGRDIARFPLICKYNDQRARGKSVGAGEYGVKTHPAWGDGQDYGYHITRTREQAQDLFLAIAHYSLGLGASRIHNWCWKDSAHSVFPWGMVYPCDEVPKEIAYVHRNQSLLFRHFAPVYREPKVYMLTPDSHRFGGGKWQVIDGVLKAVDLLLAAHVENPGTLNEDNLSIPSSARVIYYPLPFCPSDDTYAKVRDWVRNGGVLYLSGDISYDEFRKRTRTSRLEELCGVRFVSANYPNIAVNATNATDQPCIKVEPASAKVLTRATTGAPLLLQNQVGRGEVLFTTDPLELHSTPARRDHDLALYRQVLALRREKTLDLQPNDPRIHCFELPTQDGGHVMIVFNTDPAQLARTLTLGAARSPLAITVARNRPALAWFDGRGAVRAIESQGESRLGSHLLSDDQTGGIIMSLDKRDLRRSESLLLMPLRPGRIRIASERRWRSGVLSTGEIRDGKWRNYETTPMQVSESVLEVNVALRQVFSLILITDSDSVGEWSAALERPFTQPDKL